MKLTVLGVYGGFPAKDSACMGFLVETEETKILLDCGSGIASRLQKHIKIKDLDAIVLSHLHNDHISDMLVLRYAIEVGMKFSQINPINVYCPFTPEENLEFLKKEAYILNQVQEGEIKIKDLTISFVKANHNLESYSMSITDGKNKIIYTGDTGYFEGLVEFCKDADILVGECSLLESQKENTPYHMTTKELAELGVNANVETLLLSHFWYEISPEKYLEEVKKYNLGNVMVAKEDSFFLLEENCQMSIEPIPTKDYAYKGQMIKQNEVNKHFLTWFYHRQMGLNYHLNSSKHPVAKKIEEKIKELIQICTLKK